MMGVKGRLAARFQASRPIYALWRKQNCTLGEELSGSTQACCGLSEGSTSGGVQELLWQTFFWDPTRWWDNRLSKETPGYPDFRHKKSKQALWLNNRYKPPWVESQLAKLDAQTDGVFRGSVFASVQATGGKLEVHESDSQVRTCRKLCEDGQVTEAVDTLNLLVQQGCHIPNNLFFCVLKRCIHQKDLVLGRRTHDLSVQNGYDGDAFLATHLVGLYASHGRLEEAMRVFSKVAAPTAHNWASIILAYAKHGEPTQAIALYQRMPKSPVTPDNHIFVAILKACSSAGDLDMGRSVHADICSSAVKPDIFVQTCLVEMYAKCGMGKEALSLYSIMQQQGLTPPDSVTFICLLQTCASVGVAALQQGRQLHVQIEERGLQSDVAVGNSLLHMYAKCGSLEEARRLFDRFPQRGIVTWNAMIAGYAQQGLGQEALTLYRTMQQECITPPDAITFVSLLQACVSVAALSLGKQLHVEIEERGLQMDLVVGNSLVNMYAKCGSLQEAQQVFDSLPEREVVAWNALIAGYTRQGDSEVVFELIDRMMQEGVKADGITFLSVLTACSHVGEVDKGRRYFEVMSSDYGITPTIEHYTCMMDLLGRAGYLDEALWMLKTMPFKPNGAVWRTVLGACRKWSNVEIGRQAFEFAVSLDDKDASAYVLMSNIYAGAKMWDEANDMQARRRRLGASKQVGQTWWTDVDGVLHTFVV